MLAALFPESKVSSMAHVVAFGHVPGSDGRLRYVAAQGLVFFSYPTAPSVVCGVRRYARFRERVLGR